MDFINPKDNTEELEIPRFRFKSARELLKDLETIVFKGSIPGLFFGLDQLYIAFYNEKIKDEKRRRRKLGDSTGTEKDAVSLFKKGILAKNTVYWEN